MPSHAPGCAVSDVDAPQGWRGVCSCGWCCRDGRCWRCHTVRLLGQQCDSHAGTQVACWGLEHFAGCGCTGGDPWA